MKVQLEIPDIEPILFDNWEGDGEYSSKDIAEAFLDRAIGEFVSKLYAEYNIVPNYHKKISDKISDIVTDNKQEIIDKVIDKISSKIEKSKQITNEIPKKSEIDSINKEWENYFLELIDKAVARKFK